MKVTNTCRLCFEEEEDRSKLTSPCDCKGSIEYIHIRCLKLMTKQGKYKHQCPTCRSSWKKIPTPGSTKEHPIDLTHFKLEVGMLDIEPDEGVCHTMGILFKGPDYIQRHEETDHNDLDVIKPDAGVKAMIAYGATHRRNKGKTNI